MEQDEQNRKNESEKMDSADKERSENRIVTHEPDTKQLTQDEIDQHEYDVTRTAIQDDRQDMMGQKKPNDISESLNPHDSRYELSDAAIYALKTYFNPTLEHRFIGKNEYILVPKSRLKEIPASKTMVGGKVVESNSVVDEILALHGDHLYKIPNVDGTIDRFAEEYMAVPIYTTNTQPLAPQEILGVISAKTHNDLWEENLDLDNKRRGV